MLFLGKNNLISYAKDRLMILWDIEDYHQHYTLIQNTLSKITIIQLEVLKDEGYFLFAIDGEEDNNHFLTSFVNINLEPSRIADLFKM